MNLEISFRHMDHTESIDERIRDKVDNFAKKHLSQEARVQWTCMVEHGAHESKVHIMDRGHDFHVKASSDNMYKTIDQAMEKLGSQLENKGHHPGH